VIIYKRLDVSCPPKSVEVVVSICHDFGTIGIEESESSRTKARLVAFFDRAANMPLIKKAVEKAMTKTASVTYSIVEDEDWLKDFRQTQVPIEIGSRFVVSPVAGVESCERSVLYIPVERAFGTGTHVTTRHCLEAIEQHVVSGARVLDVGTGTGILALGAAACGAKRVDAIDVDPEAVEIARRNVVQNSLDGVVTVSTGDVSSVRGKHYDLVVANIATDVIVASMKGLVECCEGKGQLVLAGILEGPQESRVRASLKRNDSQPNAVRREGEWVTITAAPKTSNARAL